MKIILASKSPRRRQLVQLLGLDVITSVADVDELSVSDPDPAEDAIVTALLKARAVAAETTEDAIVIGSDTNVAYGDRVLGKPVDEAEAAEMLTLLRNKVHQVHTGIALVRVLDGRELTNVSSSDVTMRDYSDAEIAAYIVTRDPMDKAGAYAIQHPEFAPVARWDGCFAGIMGLSVCGLASLLREMGVGISAEIPNQCPTPCYRRETFDPNFA